jgi:hypothetical protein
LENYELHTVGDSQHREYWIPAGDLGELNKNIVGTIQILTSYTTVVK